MDSTANGVDETLADEATEGDEGPGAAAAPRVERGAGIGRYVVLEQLGAGAMGVLLFGSILLTRRG